MADQPPYPGTPRWVKVSGIIVIAVVLMIVIILAGVGGGHGPGRHVPSGDPPPSSVHTPPIQRGVRQP
jgi:hypothetical protein